MDRPVENFSLIETLRFEPETGFVRLRLHLARLQRSARRLGFSAPQNVLGKLEQAVAGAAAPLRVRLTLDREGQTEVTTAPFVPLLPDTVWRLRIAATRLDSADKLLRFKTTRRGIYEAARAECRPDEADEVLLLNAKDEVCEGTITSVFLEDSADLLRTPPISAGLLAGVLRTELICQRKARVGRIRLDDLKDRPLYVGNFLRGLIRAQLLWN
ncbi:MULTISPECIES: aminotransferase class IV family protein [unclassified Rhizobium]|uniref:aminotransferase class IV family protein n=1 Tax=unclassified Rhizobium TaxID=2613769 RepID=UPI00160EEBFE|nr:MULTISPECIES: aminotransferase class IV family protein [unclassified Rhizobium]MBB3617307.1 4-amino-4-deoxychorismate lyase [Rhizobium sp. BK609]MBB3682857.1 4-amino-4-deoxychorismate lyase [Rhizobium sp. BK612]